MTKKIAFIFFGILVSGALFAGGQGGSGSRTSVPLGSGVVTYPVTGSPRLTMSRGADQDITPAGYSSYNDTPGVKAWQRATGITVEFIELVDDNAYRVYLAGGNLPDIIMTDKGFYPGGPVKMYEDGLARDLTELLPGYAPEYWKFINSDPQYYRAIREPDGKHYAFAGAFAELTNTYGAWTGLVVRKEFLDRLNIQAPQTADELYTYLRRSRDELGATVPFMSADYRLNYWFYTSGSISSAFRLPSAGPYHVNGTVRYGAYQNEYREFLAYLNRLYSERLLDNNFAVTDEATANASMLNGRTALMFTAASRIQAISSAAPNPAQFNLAGLRSLSTARGTRPMSSYADDVVATGYWCFIPERSRDVPNALKFLNYLHTEKGHILSNFGEEGITYNMVNGNPVFTDFVTRNPQGLSLDSILRVQGIFNFPILGDERMMRQRFAMPQQIQAMEAWADSDGANYRIINSTVLAQYASEYANLVTDIETYINESRAQFISGTLPLTQFDQYIANLRRMGMDRLIEILQASYDQYNR